MYAAEHRIAGVVVLFDPPRNMVDNVRSYVDELECLYVVDNSDFHDPELERQLLAIPNARYVRNQGNPGQAHALNLGVAAALRDGAHFVLTMDQDSRASPRMMARMLEVLDEVPRDQIGIVAPFHLTRDRPMPPPARWQDVYTTMTSGNLLNTAAFVRAGPFQEALFLD